MQKLDLIVMQWYFELKWLSIYYNIYVKLKQIENTANKFGLAQYIVTSNVLNVMDENCKQCRIPILPVNVPQSYKLKRMKNNYILQSVYWSTLVLCSALM